MVSFGEERVPQGYRARPVRAEDRTGVVRGGAGWCGLAPSPAQGPGRGSLIIIQTPHVAD